MLTQNVAPSRIAAKPQGKEWHERVLTAALAYAAAGVPVFPIKPWNKRPLVSWGSESTTDSKQVLEYWSDFPGAMIGTPTGSRSGLYVIDIDEKNGKSGSASLAKLGWTVPEGMPTVRTATGGRHVFCAWSDEFRNTEGALGVGVDTRGEGGLVILAPSIRFEDGTGYTFENQTTIADFVALARQTPIPEALLPALRAAKKEMREEAPRPAIYTEVTTPFGERMLKKHAVVDPNMREVSLRKAAMTIAGYVGAAQISEEDARRALDEIETYLLPEAEVERAIDRGWRYGIEHPFDPPPPAPDAQKVVHTWCEPLTDDPTADPKDRKIEVLPNFGSVLTENVAAQLFADRFEGKLRFDHDRGAWYAFDGARWRHARDGRAYQWIRELVSALVKDQKEKVRFVAEKASFAGYAEKFARVDPRIRCTSDIWDQDHWSLGTPGGTVDLRTGELRPADPADAITKITSVAPTSIADCPRWLAFLDEATRGDADLISYLRVWAGYSLTGSTREQKLTFLHGPGGNGKSLFYAALLHVFGEYGKIAPFSTFVASRNEQHPTALASLRGARLVVASEVDSKQAFAEGRIKSLTGGDVIAARFMGKDFFEFEPTAKIMLVGNSLPRLTTVDDAARRRFRIVPFVNKPRVVDMQLADTFKAEASGILAWAIAGCLEWQTSGLPYPAAVREATEGFFSEQDVFGEWFGACCVLTGRSEVTATGELFESWRSYAKHIGEDPGNQNQFVATLEQRGIERFRSSKMRGLRGIRLRIAEDVRE
ncbi:phage/plasmid primase, P4 family [Aureimonas sp. D3]|uniref:phage/plasmid primase, P4 family n=1 Tax=Aureimonas sp. D3 TaxID=1638164 RepID=UPI000AB7AB0C|nr:phage/plasmid primase, P4 family [Aureimonas sp. D3]